ncbi:MAG: Transposase [Actinomycetia bacterium]|nr:Transposase [Actinomycetes bacterium]
MRGQVGPPPGRDSRTGTRGVAYRNRREPNCTWPTPAGCCPMPRTRCDARLREVEADITDIKIRSRPSTGCTPLQHGSGGETVAYVRKAGAMETVFGGMRAPSTLGSFLRAFSWENVRQLDRVHGTMTAAPGGPRDHHPVGRRCLGESQPRLRHRPGDRPVVRLSLPGIQALRRPDAGDGGLHSGRDRGLGVRLPGREPTAGRADQQLPPGVRHPGKLRAASKDSASPPSSGARRSRPIRPVPEAHHLRAVHCEPGHWLALRR